MPNVYIWPDFGEKPDPGDGGVRRVVEAQRRYLPDFGWQVVADPQEADVIAAHMTAPEEMFDNRQGLMAKPLVAHNHGFYWSEYEWGGNWAERDNLHVMKLVKAADAVTAPSEWVAQIIRRHTLRQVHTVYHGIDRVSSPNEPYAVPYVLWNKTRVDAICDPAPVVAVAQLLPDVRFVSTFVPDRSTAAMPANMQVTGKLPHLHALAYVQSAAVYLATSRETFGIGTLEAMAEGVPVVGYRTGGQAEIIDHMRTGYLAEPGDVADLARGIRWALQYRAELSAASRRVAGNFLWSDKIGAYAEIYDEVLERRKEARPKVSVIVPAYGLARYLPDTLRSVQTQTQADFECIVVDDASPDDCGRIAEEFAASDPRFKVVHNATNQYLAEARNTGIMHARGEYVLPLDADDMIEPNTLEILAGALDADRKTWIAYGGVRFVNEDGKTPTVYPGKQDQPGHSGWPVEMSIELLVKGPGQPMPYASMFRRDTWSLTGGYRRRVRSSEDCDFWMRACSYGFDARMVTTTDTLIYRNRLDSMSRVSGWADAENKDWYPWRERFDLLPAGGQSGTGIKVDAVEPPLVTVVIPVGPDHRELVRDAIDSVDAQMLRRWECIIVDDTGLPPMLDGSTYPAWARVLFTEGHEGVVKARNLGIAAAHPLSKGIVFLDADDFLMPEYLELMVDVAKRSNFGEVLYADFWEDPETPGQFRRYELPDYRCDLVLQKAMHSVTAFYPKAAIDAVDGFSDNVPWEDWDLQLKLAEAGVCARRVAAPIWTYRKHTGTRRNDRYTRREEGKADVLARWGDYIEGRKTLAGCSSCGGGNSAAMRTVYPNPKRGALVTSAPDGMPEAVLIEDSSAKSGKKTYRGKVTGAIYHFQAGQPRWVDHRDAPYFLEMPPMVRHDIETAQKAVAEAPAEMQLTAPGPPAQRAMPPTIAALAAGAVPGVTWPGYEGGIADAPPLPVIETPEIKLPPLPGVELGLAPQEDLPPPRQDIRESPVFDDRELFEKASNVTETPVRPIVPGPINIPAPPELPNVPILPDLPPPEDDEPDDIQRVPLDDGGNEVEAPKPAPAPRRPASPRPSTARPRGRPRK